MVKKLFKNENEVQIQQNLFQFIPNVSSDIAPSQSSMYIQEKF